MNLKTTFGKVLPVAVALAAVGTQVAAQQYGGGNDIMGEVCAKGDQILRFASKVALIVAGIGIVWNIMKGVAGQFDFKRFALIGLCLFMLAGLGSFMAFFTNGEAQNCGAQSGQFQSL